MSGRGRAITALWTGAVLVGLPAVTATASEPGADEGGCNVLAAARGVQVMVQQQDNLLIGEPAGAGVPVAQACVDYDVRDSRAFASSPYPGEFVAHVPAEGVPDYPPYAGSRFPGRPESKVEQPGLSLIARSSETTSNAKAQSAIDPENGIASTLTTADSAVDPAAGTSTATAKAHLQPLTFNDVLSLGEVVSVASAKLTKDGQVERSSQLQIGRTTVAGQEVAITPEGVHATGQTIGAPDTAAVKEALAQAGVGVRYLGAEQTARGVFSAGLEITMRQQDPNSSTVTVQYVLGRAFATVSPVEGDGADGGDLGGGDFSAGSAPVDGPAGGALDVPSSGDAALGDAAPPLTAPGTDTVPPPDVATDPVAWGGKPIDMGLSGAYLVLVLGGLVMVAGGTLLRLLGVKTRWTS